MGEVGTGYRFEREADYYADLQASRFGITMRKAGWDCLRHYEIAANGSVPCFRDLHDKPGLCAPFGLRDGFNCIAYRSYDDLMHRVRNVDEASYRRLQAGAMAWARENTTRRRAEDFLRSLGQSHEAAPART